MAPVTVGNGPTVQHIDDVTPHEYRHAAIPNATIDDLTGRNLLALAVLTNFIRHAESYGMTLTKLVRQAGAQGEAAISRAYNACVEAGYMGRVEFTYEKPAGDPGRSGRRATHSFVSRVPLTDDQFAAVVRSYRPGVFVMTPIGTGAYDENGKEVYELRRVRVLAAEVYCHLGAQRIDRDGLLTEHTNRRGGKSRAARERAAQQAVMDTGEQPEVTDSPEPGNPGSGVTRENDLNPQVPPEPGSPDSGKPGSINKTNEKTKEDQDTPASLRSLGTWQTPPQAPGFTTYAAEGALEQRETSGPGRVGESLPARVGIEVRVTPSSDENEPPLDEMNHDAAETGCEAPYEAASA